MADNKSVKKINVKKIIMISAFLALLFMVIHSLLATFGLSIDALFIPFRRSEKDIREYLLKIKPIETNIDEFWEIIEEQDWETNMHYFKSEFPVMSQSDFWPKSPRYDKAEEKYIFVYSNVYSYIALPLSDTYTYVHVIWVFDENSKLIDVLVARRHFWP